MVYLFVIPQGFWKEGHRTLPSSFSESIPGIFSQFLVVVERPSARLVTKMLIYYQSLTIASYFQWFNTTHYCTTNFVSGTVEKEPKGNNTYCFLNFEFIWIDNLCCYKVLQQEWQQTVHRATLSQNFRFNSEKYRKRVSYPCLCNVKVYQNKLSLGMFQKRFSG